MDLEAMHIRVEELEDRLYRLENQKTCTSCGKRGNDIVYARDESHGRRRILLCLKCSKMCKHCYKYFAVNAEHWCAEDPKNTKFSLEYNRRWLLQ
jgi:hypothetical protein